MQEEHYMTIAETAIYLRKGVATINRLARKGQIPSVKIGGSRRIPLHALEEWILSQTVKPSTMEVTNAE